MRTADSQETVGQERSSSFEDFEFSEAKATTETTSGDGTQKGAPWRALFAFTTRSHIPLMICGITASVIAGAISPAEYLIVGELLTAFTTFGGGAITKDKFLHDTSKYVMYYVALAAASWLFHSIELTIWLAFGELQAKSARDRLFYGLLEKEIAWYDMRKNGIGASLPRIQAQIRELQLATAQPMGSLFAVLSTSVLSLVQALVKSWDLTLVTLATVPLIVALAAFVGKGMQANLEKQQEKLTEAQKYTSSAFSAIETVKCFNGQPVELEKYKSAVDAAAACYARVAHSAALQMALVSFLAQAMFVQGFYYGGVLVARGNISAGDVVTTFFSALNAFQSLQGILPQMIIFEKGRTAGSTLRAIMAQISSASKIERRSAQLQPPACSGSIDVRNVSFAYPARPDQNVIEDITLYIQGGELTFLIGKSGSGKSTIGQLVMRFYESTQGQILVDDIPLQELDPEWLRSNITLVEQTSLLFNDTVFRNIALGRQDPERVTTGEVMEAVEFALLQHMINDMPKGLETEVGCKGGSMSGGQRQRMALARAKLRDTPILILDESTSALDQISRSLMMDAIRLWRHGKTTIIITHDISQIQSNDYIYLLENGRLVQEGFRSQMEEEQNFPFQAFLSEEHVTDAADSNDDASTTDQDDETPHSRESSMFALDPLEMALAMTEERATKRRTYLPDSLLNGPPGIGITYGTPGLSSAAYGSPWMRLAGSPGLDRSSPSPMFLHPVDAANVAPSEVVSMPVQSSKRLSQKLEALIEQTGKLAAAARQRATGLARNASGIRDSMAIPLAQTEGDKRSGDDIAEAEQLNSLKVIFRTVAPSLDRRGKMYLLLGFWGAAVSAVATPVFSYVLSLVLATYSVPGGDTKKALVYSMAILAISASNGFHTWLFRFMHEYTSELWVDRIRCNAFERILDQSREFFEQEENGVSMLTQNLDRNAEEMRNLLGRFASLVFVAIIMIGVSLLWAMSSQWKMTLICVALGPPIFVLTKMYTRISEKWEGRSNDASEVAAAIFTETFTNIKTVRALTLESHFTKRYVKATDDALRVGLQRAFYVGFFYGLSDSASTFGVTVVFYVGSRLAGSGAKVTDIITVFTMIIFLIGSVTGFLGFIPQVGSSKDTAARLLRLAKLPRTSHERLGDTRVTTIGDVVLEDLHFSYPRRPEFTVLKGINLTLQPGTTTAIVGTSGSGKSTVANLLLDLYSTASLPTAHIGDLTFGGRDIRHISTASLRTLIIPVQQAPTLFAATIAENITYGLPSDSAHNQPHSIELAARQAGIHDFITSLPSSYATPIGDGGTGLSGGQAQRIAIARALVRNPSVLILDEATSALDVESANLVRHTIKDLIDNKEHKMTIVIITHHRDMMEIAERIVVMDQGQIVEEGGFAELMGRDGALRNMLGGGEWKGGKKKRRKTISRMPELRDVEWDKQGRGNVKDKGKGKGKQRK